MTKPLLTKTQAAAEIRRVLIDFNLTIPFDEEMIVVTENVVLLGFKSDALSNALFDFAFPRSLSGTFYHYTSYGGFKGIVSSSKLRLYNLHRRFRSGEYRTFCRDYNLDGYVRGEHGQPEKGLFSELMDDLFYVSLVDNSDANSDRLWRTFADDHAGVRLTFQLTVNPAYPNFRRVSYQNGSQVPILRALQDAFARYDRHLVSLGISRMGGFYQRAAFSYQDEHRLLVKRVPGDPFPFEVIPVKGESYKFIECDLERASSTAFQLKLMEVVCGASCPLEKVRRYICEHSRFDNLSVSSVGDTESPVARAHG
jgi:hypothetical protein